MDLKEVYADDFLIAGWGINQIHVEIKNTEDWCEENDMKINKKKSGIIFLEIGKSNRINKKYKKLKIDNYPIIDKYKYLGTIIDNNMNLKANT